LKRIYVYIIRCLKKFFEFFGILYILEKFQSRSKFALWLSSLFAIYDLEEMVKLDKPWWTIKSIYEVENFLLSKSDAFVFEWGAGASTAWLAKRAKKVVSVEHDESWAKKVDQVTAHFTNTEILYKSPSVQRGTSSHYVSSKPGNTHFNFENYVKVINDFDQKFDLIIIDGRAREACFDLALNKVKNDGIILFDNTNRKRYKTKLHQYRDRIEIKKTWGLTIALPYPSSTYIIKKKL
jgi:hypothetical protein